jgi:hypothetical protein
VVVNYNGAKGKSLLREGMISGEVLSSRLACHVIDINVHRSEKPLNYIGPRFHVANSHPQSRPTPITFTSHRSYVVAPNFALLDRVRAEQKSETTALR